MHNLILKFMVFVETLVLQPRQDGRGFNSLPRKTRLLYDSLVRFDIKLMLTCRACRGNKPQLAT